jgi:hypothetical protein
MISIFRYKSLLIVCCLIFHAAAGQIDTVRLKTFTPPLNRQLWHGYVDNEQKNILKYDGKDDRIFSISTNDEVNYIATYAATTKIDWLQYKIEKDSLLDHNRKVYYIKGMRTLLQNLQKGWKAKDYSTATLPAAIDAYEQCVQLDSRKHSIENYISHIPYDIATPVVKSGGFDANAGIKNARNELFLKYCRLYPEKTFLVLKDNPDLPFADSLIRATARVYPDQLYNYAQAGNKLGNIIRNINDDVFISTISKMARSKSGRQYFPFLDNIVKGKMTIEEVDAVKDDSIKYYKMLVKVHLNYVERAMNKDTAFAYKELTAKLESRAKEVFINTINGLHDIENPAIRFKIIQTLSAEELYYLAVSSDGIIYTSSFVKGVYPLMMTKANQRGDSLLTRLRFDRYRKFIKMCAGYNTLSNFLSSFPKSTNPNEDDPAKLLMRAFVSGLERSGGLEDGVDVADSYASIAQNMKPLANEMLRNVQVNYERNKGAANKKGTVIYNILNKLFLSADSANKIDLTKELGIPPVYEVPYKVMTNDSGRTIMQVFFYGDKDGQGIFKGFIGMFSNANWRVDASNKQWVTITSVKGKPVTIFANRALPEETGEDEKAQEALCQYLEKNKLYPTITIHRGHSYYAPYTIAQMFSSSKIVFMGSCGGYHLINDILKTAPDAHIIASKQIGKTAVNRPFFQLLTEKVRNGNNIDWIPFWKELKKMVQVEGFEDYIPPYENLGALFIKAYKTAMEE